MTTAQIVRLYDREIASEVLRELEAASGRGREFRLVRCISDRVASAIADFIEERRPDWRVSFSTGSSGILKVNFT